MYPKNNLRFLKKLIISKKILKDIKNRNYKK